MGVTGAGWNWTAPRQVVFGWGRRGELGGLLKQFAKRVWVVPGSRRLTAAPVWQEILSQVVENEIEVEQLPIISREPLVEDVDRLVIDIRKRGLRTGDAILAIGGGSAIDLGKAVAGLVTQSDFQTVVDYLEGVGTGKRLQEPPIPFVAMPTTAGTGSEATRNAVISSLDPAYKKSLRSPLLVPELVVIDSELTVTASVRTTVSCGMDALTQLLESFISRRATSQTRALALEGLAGFPEALRRAVADPRDRVARERLAYGAYLSGLTLANGGLGIAHGIAAALGVQCQIAHGLACAVVLQLALKLNFESCQELLAEVGRLWNPDVGADRRMAAQSVLETVDSLLNELKVPRRLSELGVSGKLIPELVRGSHGNSRQGNPIPLEDSLIHKELEMML